MPLRLDGGSNSTPTLRATNASTSSAVLGEHVDGTRGYLGGEDTGACGQNDFSAGRGVYGYAGHASGPNHGVIGASESTAGTGARGAANATSGETYGMFGTTASPDGYAMWGENEATGAFGYVGGGRGANAGVYDGDVDVQGNPTVGGTIDPPSCRTLKEDIVPIDGVDVLRTLSTVPVTRWRYAGDETRARHLGPMAEGSHEAFGLGSSRERISTIDADGVALAAIQGLYLLVQERDARIAELEARLAALEAERP